MYCKFVQNFKEYNVIQKLVQVRWLVKLIGKIQIGYYFKYCFQNHVLTF